MDSSRTNLDEVNHNSSYLLLSLALLALSGLGIYLFLQFRQPQKPTSPSVLTPTPTITESTLVVSTSAPISSPSSSLSVSPTTTSSPTPTPLFLNYQSPEGYFSVTHSSSRQVYHDTPSYGHRYTFYRQDSTITVHIGQSWSWSHPGRTFSSDFLVSGQPSFRFDITAQTIVDFQKDNLLYTIQCLHHSKDSVKSECDQFITNFKIQST